MKKDLSRVVLACALLLTFVPPRALAAQAAGGGVTKEEEAEARAVASAFVERMFEARDFGAVVREMYAEGFMKRYLRNQHDAARGPNSTFMLEGVPSLTFGRQLAAHADDEHWQRLFVAGSNMILYGLLSSLSRQTLEEMSDADKVEAGDVKDVFPPEAVKVLDANPALANFIEMKGGPVVIKTDAELRAATEGMEEAERLTRASLAERAPKSQAYQHNLALLKALPSRTDVSLVEDADWYGYPKGARLFKVFAPLCYNLILVREGGKMKIVWAVVADD